jgi:hypothetical protein
VPKSEFIIVRVDADTKGRIEEAARRQGLSLSTFVLRAAERAAAKEKPMKTEMLKPRGRGGCPTFFVALCGEARRGGESSYYGAGHELMRHVAALRARHLNEEEWGRRLDRLAELLQGGQDEEGVWQWFQEELPRCMVLVPTRRRDQFLKGVYAMWEEDPGVLPE